MHPKVGPLILNIPDAHFNMSLVQIYIRKPYSHDWFPLNSLTN